MFTAGWPSVSRYKRDDFFPGQLVGGTPAHDRQHIALLDDSATLLPNTGPWDSTSAKWRSRRRKAAEQEAAARRALGPQIIEDSVKLVEAWNARQAAHMPMLFSPTIEAAITAGYWFLRARCPACRTTGDVDLRQARLAPRRGRDGAYPGAVVPIVPAECAVR